MGGVVPLAVAHHFGALGIPRNDDWSYVLATFRLADTGTVDLNGWATVNVVGQMLPAVPLVWVFGERITALQVEVAAFGVAGLVAVYAMGCAIVSRRQALFVALVVGVSPMWAPLAVSFMTDVPAFALAMVVLAIGVRAVMPDGRPGGHALRVGPYVIAMAVGFWAYTVRDNTVVVSIALTSVGAWCAWKGSRRDRALVAAGAVAWLALVAVFLVWKHRATGYQTPTFALHPTVASTAVRRSLQMLITLGLLIAPVVILAGPVRMVRTAYRRAPRAAVLVGAVVGGTVVALMLTRGRPLGTGNYVQPNGTLGSYLLPGARDALFPAAVPVLLGAVAAAAITVAAMVGVPPCADLLVRVRARAVAPPPDPPFALLAVAALGFGGFIVASGVAGNALWDRYVMMLVPLVSFCLLRAARRVDPAPATPRRAGAVVALGLLAGFGLVFAANSAAYDGARWEVAAAAARIVGDPTRVDGGFEWVDYHVGREVYLGDVRRDRFCVVLRSRSARPDADDPRIVGVKGVWGPRGDQTWIVARTTGRCDPD